MFGLNEYERNKALQKIKNTRTFMQTNGIEINGKNIPFANFFKNAFINTDRYLAEINHRVYSLYEYSQDRGLSNAFVTLTAPSEYHPTTTIRGKKQRNKNYGGRNVLFVTKHPLTGERVMIFNSDENKKKYSPRETSKLLSHMVRTIVSDRLYKGISKDDKVYFRVTEPHKDGCPHVHISFFIPDDKIEAFKALILRLYPEPRSKVEINVDNPVSYLMKYILKTLDDLRGNDSKLTDLSLWYVYHGISRIYTSRTFVSLDIYRCLGGRFDLKELTSRYNDETLTVIVDKITKKVELIYDEQYLIYSRKVVKTSQTFKPSFENVPKKWKQSKPKQAIDFVIDGECFSYYNNEVYKPIQSPKLMSDFALYDYYNELDIETVNLQHYQYTKNELINRVLLNDTKQTLNLLDDYGYECFTNMQGDFCVVWSW